MSKQWSVILLALGAFALAGCVDREMTITSTPPGARVWVSDVEVGSTPLKIPFTWNGDYDIVLRKDGYQTSVTHADINMTWYEVPPLDLLSELAPWTYRDSRYINFDLQKQTEPSDKELLEGADALNKRLAQPVKH